MRSDPQSSICWLPLMYEKVAGRQHCFGAPKIVLRSDSTSCTVVLRRVYAESKIKNEARPYDTMPLICTMRMNAHEIGDAIKLERDERLL